MTRRASLSRSDREILWSDTSRGSLSFTALIECSLSWMPNHGVVRVFEFYALECSVSVDVPRGSCG